MILFLLSIVLLIFFSLRSETQQDKWLAAREKDCFNEGGEFSSRKDRARCVHRDGRIDLKEWKPL